MVQYIYFVKCPGCEDEHFDFFDEAKSFAMDCLSKKPIITQIEVCRNDFGECTDSTDLGTVWSWNEIMKDIPEEPEAMVFTKDDLCSDSIDSEFDSLDNSVDYEVAEPVTFEVSAIDDVPDNFRKPIPKGMTIEQLVEEMEENEEIVECKECFNLFSKEACTKSDKGYVCATCSNGSLNEDGPSLRDIANTASAEYSDKYTEQDILDAAGVVDSDAFTDIDTYNSINTEEPFTKYAMLRKIKAKKQREMAMTESFTDDEDFEDDENTVQCTWCNDLFDKDECRKEINLGWLCSRCEAAIKSRGETLTFRENSYWDFLDESTTKDPLDHHDPDYSDEAATEFLATKANKVKDARFDAAVDALAESASRETVDLEYDDLTITIYGPKHDVDDWDEVEHSGSYTLTLDKDEVATTIWENFITEEDVTDVPGGLEILYEDDDAWSKFLETHFDILFEKYYDALLKHYEDEAIEAYGEDYGWSDYQYDLEGTRADYEYESSRDDFFESTNKKSMLEELDQEDIKTITDIVNKANTEQEKNITDNSFKNQENIIKAIQSEADYLADGAFKHQENIIKAVERENDLTYDSLKILAKNDQAIYSELKK